jgi:hypothetical protein
MATYIISDDPEDWVLFLRDYASSRIHAIQPGFATADALVLIAGPRAKWGTSTLAMELSEVLTLPREILRSIIAKKLLKARKDFRRKPQ